MDERYATLMATRRRKVGERDPEGLHVLVIDELAFYLRGGKKETRERFAELLRDLVSRGRAAGIIVVAATQKPSHDIVPTWIRDLFSFRLAMRCTSSDASDTILGQGWAHQGYSAASIDPTLRGVGYLLAEGGTPVLLMTPYLSDDDVDELALRSFEQRGGV
jgi:S-DNA-T family DNA segregation ATPase FtsK/SpoIIIE